MHRLFIITLSLLAFSCLSAKHHKSSELKPIFDGKTLEGWTQKNGTATYVVKDGAILGTTKEGSPNSSFARTSSMEISIFSSRSS